MKNYLVAVDHINRTIAVSPQQATEKPNKLFDIQEFKKIMLKQKVNARITQSGEEKILTIDNITDPNIQGYRIYYSPVTYRIHKMLIGMARQNQLEENDDDDKPGKKLQGNNDDDEGVEEYYYYLQVEYNSVQTLSLNTESFNPENKFIKIHDGKIELMPAFSNYQLVGAGNE